jgi:hypothetical protein
MVMHSSLYSLLLKERIKLRLGAWLLPLLLIYAATDSFLILKAIQRSHGSFGLVLTLLSKEPMFFAGFRVLFLAGALLAFLQIWPEVQGNRLRLLFHTPVHPEGLVGTTLACGLGLMLLTNLGAHLALAGNLLFFRVPIDIIMPVLLTLASWSMLSLVFYLGTAAFFFQDSLVVRGFVLLSCFAMYGLMGHSAGYGLQAPSLGPQALLVLLFIALVFFACLRFMSAPDQRLVYRWARAASLLLVILSLCAVLSNLYWRMATPKLVRHKLFYSPVHEQFVISKHFPDKVIGPAGTDRTRIELEDGTVLSRRQMFLALPTLHADSLLKWNVFPDSIQGLHLTPEQARSSWQYLSFHPRDWNAPEPRLHLMLESEPEGAKLELPTDFFRLTAARHGLEFIVPQTGRVDREKSRRFTAALREAGFEYPVQALAGNPDPRKDYDEGYLLLDARNRLFQLKMVHGAPVCRAGGVIEEGSVRGLVVAERRRREMLGFVITEAEVYAVMQGHLALRPIPVAGFDADRTSFSLWADAIGKYVVGQDVTDNYGGSLGQAMTPEFAIHREYAQPLEPDDIRTLRRCEQLASLLLPWRLTQQDGSRAFVHLRLEPPRFVGLAAGGNLFCLLLFVALGRLKRTPLRYWECGLIGVFGASALAVLWLEKFPVSRTRLACGG